MHDFNPRTSLRAKALCPSGDRMRPDNVANASGSRGSTSGMEVSSSRSLTLRIIATSALIAICYLTIGFQLAVVPRLVHLRLGYSPVVAGLAISAQYVATLLSRPLAGRTADRFGAKRTACSGLLVCGASGVGFTLAAFLQESPSDCVGVLLISRVLLGFGESWVATGSTLWGIGRVGAASTAHVISWAGIASYGALAAGAPIGIWLENTFGIAAIGVASVVASIVGFSWAMLIGGIAILPGDELPFGRVLRRVLPFGLSLASGGIGFGVIATFTTLYYASRHWHDAGLALVLFGASFVAARLLFVRTIDIWGGFRVTIVSLAVESGGLLLLWLGALPSIAALSGFGFALVFPALGVEAVRTIPARSRGAALGVFTAFVDLSIGISGPIAGLIVSALGYPPIFLFGSAMAATSAVFLIALSRNQAAAQPQISPGTNGVGAVHN